jgi:PAS domain S-box-containing protein
MVFAFQTHMSLAAWTANLPEGHMKSQHAVKSPAKEKVAEAFSFMVEAVSDYAIFLLDLNGIVLTWNKAAEVMKGYTAQEIIGQPFAVLYTEEDQASNHAQQNLDRAAQDGTFQEETWRKKKDGSLFWAMVEIIAIRAPDGMHTGYCKLTRDITVRKKLQD